MNLFDNKKKNSVAGATQEAGTADLGILRNPPPPSPLPQWSKDDAQTQRSDRYKALSASRSILLTEGKKRFPLLPTKYHRTTLCKHSLTGAEVAVLYQVNTTKRFLTGYRRAGVCGCVLCVLPKFKSVEGWKLPPRWNFSTRQRTTRP